MEVAARDSYGGVYVILVGLRKAQCWLVAVTFGIADAQLVVKVKAPREQSPITAQTGSVSAASCDVSHDKLLQRTLYQCWLILNAPCCCCHTVVQVVEEVRSLRRV